MHIALDLDDVCLDFVSNLVSVINREYDAGLSEDSIYQWELADILDPILGESWWSWWERREWLWSLAPAVPGAIGGIEKLRRDGHYLEVLTAKPRWAEAATWKWLGRWRPPVHRVTIVDLATSKQSVTDADLLVDDLPSNVESWVKSRANRRAILFRRPHNRNAHIRDPRISEAHNWQDILKEANRWTEANSE